MDDQAAGQIRLRSQSPFKFHGASQAGGVEQVGRSTNHRFHTTPTGTMDHHPRGTGPQGSAVEGTGQSGGCVGGSC
eukprot:862829-Alexandrium_andersonii.AAC.1